jgi:hypothetical protein
MEPGKPPHAIVGWSPFARIDVAQTLHHLLDACRAIAVYIRKADW